MYQRMLLPALVILFAVSGFAATWSGWMVDSKCYGAEERNVNPNDTQTAVDRDIGYEIRYCTPTHKTKYFAIVDEAATRLKFDAAGNAKAAELVKNFTKKRGLLVTVTGQLVKNTIHVDSVSPVQPKR